MLTVVWTRVQPYIDMAFARLIILAGLRPEDYHEPLPSKAPSSANLITLKDAPRRKRTRQTVLPNS